MFFKSENPKSLRAWYETHLGMPMESWGSVFRWIDPDKPNAKEHASTSWSAFEKDTGYFSPSEKPFMFNYRVEDLDELLKTLRAEGVYVFDKIEDYPYGKFGWIMDPEGNKIELWEPKDDGF